MQVIPVVGSPSSNSRWDSGFCLILISALALLNTPCDVYAQADDFNDGNDLGWTRYSPLAPYGVNAIFSFTNGAYRIQTTQPSPDPANLGTSRAYSLRRDVTYTNFYVSVDVVNWNDTPGQSFGLVARVGTPGLGTSSGYAFTYNRYTSGSDVQISRVDQERPHPVPTGNGTINLDPAKPYRFVFFGIGSQLEGRIYDLLDTTTPVITISGNDATYSNGFGGLVVYSNSGTNGTTDATFDNYLATQTAAPTLQCPSNLTVLCLSNVPPPNPSAVVVSNGCAPLTVTNLADVFQTNPCTITISRTYQVTDACSNVSVCTQTIAVQDTTPPTFLRFGIPFQSYTYLVGCPSDLPPPPFVEAVDSCGAALAVRRVSFTNGNPITNVLHYWFATNRCGVTGFAVQTNLVACRPPHITNEPSITSFLTPNGISVSIAVAPDGTPPFNLHWAIGPTYQANTVSASSPAVYSFVIPVDQVAGFLSQTNFSQVSVNLSNCCGQAQGSGGFNPPCVVCLSRGVPITSSAITSASQTGPQKTNDCGSNSVVAKWFTLASTDSGMADISVLGTATNNFASVYLGPLNNLVPVACNRSTTNVQTRLQFEASPGQPYWLVVTNVGTLLNLTYGFVPKITSFGRTANDQFELRSGVAPPLKYTFQGATSLLTGALWSNLFSSTFSTNGAVYVDTNSSQFNSRFYRIAPER